MPPCQHHRTHVWCQRGNIAQDIQVPSERLHGMGRDEPDPLFADSICVFP